MSGESFGLYSHDGPWHNVNNATALGVQGFGIEPAGIDITGATNPQGFGTNGLTFLLDDVLNNDAEFTAQAGMVYTIYVGGFQDGLWLDTTDNYQLTIAGTHAVPCPLPAATWLFGGALFSLGGALRRRRLVAA